MATQQRTIEYLIEQATCAGAVSAKPMFGEYGVYVDGRMIGSFCDDQLFVKPTASGRFHAEPVPDAPPYPGAKPQMPIEADRWDNAEWLQRAAARHGGRTAGNQSADTEAGQVTPVAEETQRWSLFTVWDRSKSEHSFR